MQTTRLMQQQLAKLSQRFQLAIADLTDSEWTARAMPNTNLPGYICWHIANTLDSTVQTLIRGIPEISTQEPWASSPGFMAARIETITSIAEADAIAYQITRSDVQAYEAVVAQTIQSWLGELTDDEFDRRSDCLAHVESYPEYQTGLRREIAAYMATLPMSELLGYYCCSHPFQHLGELALLKQFLRMNKEGDNI